MTFHYSPINDQKVSGICTAMFLSRTPVPPSARLARSAYSLGTLASTAVLLERLPHYAEKNALLQVFNIKREKRNRERETVNKVRVQVLYSHLFVFTIRYLKS